MRLTGTSRRTSAASLARSRQFYMAVQAHHKLAGAEHDDGVGARGWLYLFFDERLVSRERARPTVNLSRERESDAACDKDRLH